MVEDFAPSGALSKLSSHPQSSTVPSWLEFFHGNSGSSLHVAEVTCLKSPTFQCKPLRHAGGIHRDAAVGGRTDLVRRVRSSVGSLSCSDTPAALGLDRTYPTWSDRNLTIDDCKRGSFSLPYTIPCFVTVARHPPCLPRESTVTTFTCRLKTDTPATLEEDPPTSSPHDSERHCIGPETMSLGGDTPQSLTLKHGIS